MNFSVQLDFNHKTFKEMEEVLNKWMQAQVQSSVFSLLHLGGIIDNGRRIAEDTEECEKRNYQGTSPDNRFNAWTKDVYCQEHLIPFYNEHFGILNKNTFASCRNIYLQFRDKVEIASRIPKTALMELAAPRNDNVREHVIARLKDMRKIKGSDVVQAIEKVREEIKPLPPPRESLKALNEEKDAWMKEKGFVDLDKKSTSAFKKILNVKTIEEKGVDEVRKLMHEAFLIAEPGPLTKSQKTLARIYLRESKGLNCPQADRDAMQEMFSIDEIKRHGQANCEKRLTYIIKTRAALQDIINNELMNVQDLAHKDFEALYALIAVPRLLELDCGPCERELREKIEELKTQPKIDVAKAQDRLLLHMETKLQEKQVADEQKRGLREFCSISTIREVGEKQCQEKLDAMIETFASSMPALRQTHIVVLGEQLQIPVSKNQAYTALGEIMRIYDDRDFAFSVLDALRDQVGDDEGLMEYLNHVEQCVK